MEARPSSLRAHTCPFPTRRRIARGPTLPWLALGLWAIACDRNILGPATASTSVRPDRIASYGRVPPQFIENRGQVDPRVAYYLKGPYGTIFFTAQGVVYDLWKKRPDTGSEDGTSPSLSGESLQPRPRDADRPFDRLSFRTRFMGANGHPRIERAEERPGKVNCFVGSPDRWRTDVPTAGAILYRDLYPGIDLRYHFDQSDLEYTFVVNPGADPGAIRVAYEGIEGLRLDAEGNLVLSTPFGEMLERAPFVYQVEDGVRSSVGGSFAIEGKNLLSFRVPAHDEGWALLIDPVVVLSTSTYLGGSIWEDGRAVVLDSAGRAYIAGATSSNDFPTKDAYQTKQPYNDAFVTKLSSSGTQIVFSTYLGGSGNDQANGIALDPWGYVYVAGYTTSTDFPTARAYQGTNQLASAAFVTELTPSGNSLYYSTYLDGGLGEEANAIAVDSAGYAYVAGWTGSPDFPTVSAYQSTHGGSRDAFVSKLDVTGSSLVFSTFLGGGGRDSAEGIALDDNVPYVVGETMSGNFPLASAYDSSLGSLQDGFVTRFYPSGQFLYWSTYLGGSLIDNASALAVDPYGYPYVTGWTSSDDFPTVNPYQATHAGGEWDAFATKFDPNGSFLWYSTYLGHTIDDQATGIAVDSSSSAYVTGGDGDAFVWKLAWHGGAVEYFSHPGGSGTDTGKAIAVGPDKCATIVGSTTSTNYPVRVPIQSSLKGSQDALVTRLCQEPSYDTQGRADYNGDKQDDLGVFRNGMWFLSYSPYYTGVDQAIAFGSPTPGTDSPEIGEFGCLLPGGGNVDGQTDLAVLRKPYSTWFVTLSPNWSSTPNLAVTFGTTNHKRIPMRRFDTNGDGCSDIGVFRNGCFDILESPSYAPPARHVCFGLGTDVPFAADLNGDGTSDLILWRPATSHYTYRLSPNYDIDWGANLGSGDVPLVGDFNGDGWADLGSYNRTYSTFRFSYAPFFLSVDLVRTHGVNGDIPIVADMNGDGISDIGIFRNAIARWWFLCSPSWSASCLSQSFGKSGDVPIFGKPSGIP